MGSIIKHAQKSQRVADSNAPLQYLETECLLATSNLCEHLSSIAVCAITS